MLRRFRPGARPERASLGNPPRRGLAETFPLARKLRYYGKKRGARRTGSKTLGSAGEAVFFLALLLLGCVGLGLGIAWLVIPEWRVNNRFVEHSCTVLDKRLAVRAGESAAPAADQSVEAGGARAASDGVSGRQSAAEEPPAADGAMYRAEVQIEYRIGGETFRTWTYDIATARDLPNSYSSNRDEQEALLEAFIVDPQKPRRYACWYDPADPNVVVLVRGYSGWLWLVFAVPISFILIGGGGAIYALFNLGKSAERRAAMAQWAQRELFGNNGRRGRRYPTVPNGADMTNSPGTRLRFRLPVGVSPGWKLFLTLAACVAWNGAVVVLLVIAIARHAAGAVEPWRFLLLAPFVLIGAGLIGYLIRQLLMATGIGPTFVEISDHPLKPGGQYRLFLSQAGRLKFRSLCVALVCEEEAAYRQGTNTRAETRQVYRQELLCREDFRIERGRPFESESELTVPEGAMHSFKADHNEIRWKVVVSGEPAGWPRYERAFRVIIHPASGRSSG
jgi:hypothetical protein